MMYEIIRAAAPAPAYACKKTAERLTMEELEVGDAFLVTEYDAQQRCACAMRYLRPKRFSIRKVPGKGWQVRRID